MLGVGLIRDVAIYVLKVKKSVLDLFMMGMSPWFASYGQRETGTKLREGHREEHTPAIMSVAGSRLADHKDDDGK